MKQGSATGAININAFHLPMSFDLALAIVLLHIPGERLHLSLISEALNCIDPQHHLIPLHTGLLPDEWDRPLVRGAILTKVPRVR